MQIRKLGQTDLRVSIIGFGGSALGNVFGDVTDAAGQRAVDTAIDAGINFFDTSPYYGLTLAEERLGRCLQHRRTEVLLSTKCGRYGAEAFDFSARTIEKNFEQSLRRLRTDYVDLLQVHDLEFGSVEQILDETMPALRRLQAQGKVRYLGLTSYWPGLLGRLAVAAQADCVLNYCHANLFADDIVQHLVPAAQAAGFGIINASPLHMGLLGDKPIPAWHPAPLAVREAAIAVRALCHEHQVDPGTLALRACLEFAPAASTLVGISTAEEVYAATAALTWRPPEGLLEKVDRIVRPVHNQVWASGLRQNADTVAPYEQDALHL